MVLNQFYEMCNAIKLLLLFLGFECNSLLDLSVGRNLQPTPPKPGTGVCCCHGEDFMKKKIIAKVLRDRGKISSADLQQMIGEQ